MVLKRWSIIKWKLAFDPESVVYLSQLILLSKKGRFCLQKIKLKQRGKIWHLCETLWRLVISNCEMVSFSLLFFYFRKIFTLFVYSLKNSDREWKSFISPWTVFTQGNWVTSLSLHWLARRSNDLTSCSEKDSRSIRSLTAYRTPEIPGM